METSAAEHADSGSQLESIAIGGIIQVTEPATGEVIGRVSIATIDQVAASIGAARDAFRSWREVPAVERARYFFRFADLLESHREELAMLISRENGKTLADSRAEVRRAIEVVEFACGMPTLLMGDSLEDIARDIDSQSIRQPLGVCVGITPFNFPVMVPAWMYPVAIAAGNTFVLKPSPQTPLSAVRMVELFYQCGFPKGVLNLVHGERAVAEALITHPDVSTVSFVGSSAVARQVQRLATEHHKRVQALGGAKNFMIVMPDGVSDRTIDAIMSSAFGGCGQRCLAGSAIIAVGDAGDEVIYRLKASCERLTLGSPLDEKVGMGPLISDQARARVQRYIDDGLRSGAKLVVDGRVYQSPNPKGNFLGPTIFDQVDPASSIAREEIFGPVLSVLRVPDLEQALAIANQSEYGNAASIFTQSGAAARAFTAQIEAGMVGVNVGVAAPMAFFPFGGMKASIFGDLRIHGRDGVAFYTRQKIAITRW